MILRDPTGKVPLRVVEQNYRFQSVSQGLLLSKFEGRTVPFLAAKSDGKPGEIVQGKIIRSGYVPRSPDDSNNNRSASDETGEAGSAVGPIVEVNGSLRFSLPGEPLFPSLGDDALLRPTLNWTIYSPAPAKLDAELAYITNGMTWQADYSVIAAEEGDSLDLVGLVTISNRSGKSFENAKIKLMAGEVNVVEYHSGDATERVVLTGSNVPAAVEGPPEVKVKDFDEYHLYSLPLPTSLRDQETKQVEFARAVSIPGSRVYVYDGYKPDPQRVEAGMEGIRGEPGYGVAMTTKVRVLREFKNTDAAGLGIALPKGRLRFYRRDNDGQLEFTGENIIDHTPKDETLSIYSGDAFDLVGSRTRTDFKTDNDKKYADESFEILVTNHKKTPVEIRVIEHLYRWTNWVVTKPAPWTKVDAQTMETRVSLKPDEEKTVDYTVHYSW